jgi:hypothetical protein
MQINYSFLRIIVADNHYRQHSHKKNRTVRGKICLLSLFDASVETENGQGDGLFNLSTTPFIEKGHSTFFTIASFFRASLFYSFRITVQLTIQFIVTICR